MGIFNHFKKSGFRPIRSTELALAQFTDSVFGNMDPGHFVGAVFLIQ